MDEIAACCLSLCACYWSYGTGVSDALQLLQMHPIIGASWLIGYGHSMKPGRAKPNKTELILIFCFYNDDEIILK